LEVTEFISSKQVSVRFDFDIEMCTREIEARIAMTRPAFNRKKTLFSSKLDL
jgi:hypothetical protein